MNFASPFGNRLGLRITPAGVKHTLAMCLAFTTLLFAGAQAGREFSTFWYPAGSSALAPAVPLVVIEPVAQFSQTRIGHLLFTSIDDDSCRHVLFDNRTGATVEAGRIVCNASPARAPDVTGEVRMRSLRNSFAR
jgi:hypothetical protein